MTKLINAQRGAIAYYQNLKDKETNPIKIHLLEKEIELSEKDLNRLMKPKKENYEKINN